MFPVKIKVSKDRKIRDAQIINGSIEDATKPENYYKKKKYLPTK